MIDRILEAIERRSPTLLKLVKYSAASAVAVPVQQLLLFSGIVLVGLRPLVALVIAVCISSIPNYLINRNWTWHQTGKNRLWGEVVPFWAMGILGAILSFIAVAWTETRTDATWAYLVASLVPFGMLWLAKFLILDRLMWRVITEIRPELDLEAAHN